MRASRREEGYRSAVLLGVVAGMRSQLPLALLARTGTGPRLVRRGLLLAAVGEFAADKLPVAPNRLEAGPLAGRVILGAVAGMIAARRHATPGPVGALLGALGAGVGSFAAYHVRAVVERSIPIPDAVVGAAEDVVALGLGLSAARSAIERE